MSQISFSSTQLYRIPPTIGGLVLIGNIVYLNEQNFIIFLIQYLLMAFVLFITKGLKALLTFHNKSFRVGVVVIAYCVIGQAIAVSVPDIQAVAFYTYSMAHGFSVGILVFLIVNPKKLIQLGGVDLDKSYDGDI